MNKTLLDRLASLERRYCEHKPANSMSRAELMRVIVEGLGFVPTHLEIMELARNDRDAEGDRGGHDD